MLDVTRFSHRMNIFLFRDVVVVWLKITASITHVTSSQLFLTGLYLQSAECPRLYSHDKARCHLSTYGYETLLVQSCVSQEDDQNNKLKEAKCFTLLF